MARKNKEKAAKAKGARKVSVEAYSVPKHTRKFSGRLPPRDDAGRFKKRSGARRKTGSGQQNLF